MSVLVPLLSLAIIFFVVRWAKGRAHKKNKNQGGKQTPTAAQKAVIENERASLEKLGASKNTEEIRLGASYYEVISAFGIPAASDRRVTKTKNLEVLKYQKHGRGYKLKITLENDIVVGWEDRR